ncbi:MAG: hypothetical protein GXP56_05000 [Deltaproteobacteria bacterium]|nr:hypothetical protein [Deltaproteobacteria bacterium]
MRPFFFNKYKLLFFVLLAGVSLFLTSCHSKYLTVNIEICRSPVWNNKKTAVAFMVTKMAYRRAGGIASLPDGGMSKIEYQDVSLYYFNLQDKQLIKVDDFNDITKWITAWRSNYDGDIAFQGPLIYYKIKPNMWKLDKFKTGPDSLKVHSVIERYNKSYAYDINTHNIRAADSLIFNEVFNKTKNSNKVAYEKLDSLLKEVALKDWGIVLKDIYPQSNQDYIDHIIYNQGTPYTRQAIMEQIIPGLSKKKIKNILEEMDNYKKKLDKKDNSSYKDHVRKLNYDNYYKETCKKLNDFL